MSTYRRLALVVGTLVLVLLVLTVVYMFGMEHLENKPRTF